MGEHVREPYTREAFDQHRREFFSSGMYLDRVNINLPRLVKLFWMSETKQKMADLELSFLEWMDQWEVELKDERIRSKRGRKNPKGNRPG
jgi:DNA invertase Pin-like site-specific DNA recombinase